MSKLSDTRPLNARSIALSALLGTHPPTLTAGALVSLAELFGINGGTMRTALSRMVAAGDLTADGGRYTLSDRLVERQAAQDSGRRTPTGWNGTWHTAIALADQRDLADRRQLRSVMANARFGELRPTVWIRPANVPIPDLGPDWLATTGPLNAPSSCELAARLWDLPDLARRADALDVRIVAAGATLDRDDPADIPPAFTLSAEVVRFLRSEPLLPDELTAQLTNGDWPVERLRRRYDDFERTLQSMLRPVLGGTP